MTSTAKRPSSSVRIRTLYRESLSTYAEAGNPAGADDVLRRLLALEPVPGTSRRPAGDEHATRQR